MGGRYTSGNLEITIKWQETDAHWVAVVSLVCSQPLVVSCSFLTRYLSYNKTCQHFFKSYQVWIHKNHRSLLNSYNIKKYGLQFGVEEKSQPLILLQCRWCDCSPVTLSLPHSDKTNCSCEETALHQRTRPSAVRLPSGQENPQWHGSL